MKQKIANFSMRIILGLIFILFAGFGWFTQLISCISPSFARKLGFQEKSEDTDPLFRRAEFNAACWDALTLWVLALAGALMLSGHRFWPYISLIAGGIYLDTAGRETAKYICLLKSGIKTGTQKNIVVAFITYLLIAVFGIVAIVYALMQII